MHNKNTRVTILLRDEGWYTFEITDHADFLY